MVISVADTGGALSDLEHSRQLRRAVIASTIGTTIEWYDFFISGTIYLTTQWECAATQP